MKGGILARRRIQSRAECGVLIGNSQHIYGCVARRSARTCLMKCIFRLEECLRTAYLILSKYTDPYALRRPDAITVAVKEYFRCDSTIH